MTLEAGTRVGKYEIKQLLGAGGMGEVYLAQDAELGRSAALKILPGGGTQDRQRITRFTQEARAASALNHPNILTIYDVGHEGPLHFIAAEYIEGETLQQLSQGRRLSVDEVLDVAAQVADALAAAHEAGIVHRDVKPENVMVRRRDGYVKVLDFGLAKLGGPHPAAFDSQAPTEALGQATQPGMLVGTVPYMSPEQARGESLDARTDVFSFGVMLYELTSGRHPFKRASYAETVAAVLTYEPPFDEDLTGAPEELRALLRRCLEKERERRYADAGELLTDVRQLRHAHGGTRRDGQRFSSAAGTRTRGGVANTNPQEGRTRALEPARTQGEAAGAPAVVVANASMRNNYPAYSPDGKYLAFQMKRGDDTHVMVMPAEGGEPSQLTNDRGQSWIYDWSPDGGKVLFAGLREGLWNVWWVSRTTKEERRLTDYKKLNSFVRYPSWSPKGDRVAYEYSETTGNVWVADLK